MLLAELFEAHASLVLGVCRGMLRDAHEAEDAAQQTFLSAYVSLMGGTSPREPAAWLATIARNECRSRVQQQMRAALPVAEALGESSDPMQHAARAEEVESLRHALIQLPLQQRHAFLLREFTGLSYEELAVALGVSRPAVESLLFRARQQLRGSLRSAVAAAASLPAGLRDWFTQLVTGSPDSAGTLAKLGSAPLLAKLGVVTASTAFVTAGAVNVLPARHHPKPQRALAAGTRARPAVALQHQASAQPAASPKVAAPVSAATDEAAPRSAEHSSARAETDGGDRARTEPRHDAGGNDGEASRRHDGKQTIAEPEPVQAFENSDVEHSSDGSSGDSGPSSPDAAVSAADPGSSGSGSPDDSKD